MSDSAERPQVTISGRWASNAQPVFQNLPDSFANCLMWAFERNDFSEVRRRLASGDLEPVQGPVVYE